MQIRCFCDLYVSEQFEKKKNQVLKKLTEENIIQYNRKKLVFLNKEYFLKYFEDM